MRLRLHILVPPQPPVPFDHDGPVIAIGRDPKGDLTLTGEASTSVSWRHARITLTDDCAYVHDLESSNGTFVNDRRVKEPRAVRVGDYIRLGQEGPILHVLEVDLTPGSPRGRYIPTAREELRPRMPVADSPDWAVAAPAEPPLQKQQVRGVPTLPRATVAAPLPQAEPVEPPVRRPPVTSQTTTSTTRRLIVAMQGSQRRMRVLVALVVLLVAALLVVLFLVLQGKLGEVSQQADDLKAQAEKLKGDVTGLKDKPERKADPPPPVVTGAAIYKQTLRSTAWIVVPRGPGRFTTGTGALVDRERRLLVTAQHVIEGGGPIRVFFPSYESPGNAISEPAHYFKAGKDLAGRVVISDPKRDLAVIQLDRVPADVPALPLAAKSPEPGDRVHTVGNPGASKALWVYTEGHVRQVFRNQLRANDPGLPPQEIDAWMVMTQSPINPGDSGGPVVNDRGELIAVNSTFTGKARLVSNCIDIREIRTVLSLARP